MAWTRGRPPELAHPARDPLGQVDVRRVQVDVVGDQERPRSDRHGATGGVQSRRPEVGLVPVLSDLLPQALVLGPPQIREDDAIGPRRGPGVQVDRQLEPLRDRAPRTAGPARRTRPWCCRRAARTAPRRPPRCAGAGPRGRSCRCAAGRRPRPPPWRPPRARAVAGEGEHGAVVVGIGRAVEQVHARRGRHRGRQLVDHRGRRPSLKLGTHSTSRAIRSSLCAAARASGERRRRPQSSEAGDRRGAQQDRSIRRRRGSG